MPCVAKTEKEKVVGGKALRRRHVVRRRAVSVGAIDKKILAGLSAKEQRQLRDDIQKGINADYVVGQVEMTFLGVQTMREVEANVVASRPARKEGKWEVLERIEARRQVIHQRAVAAGFATQEKIEPIFVPLSPQAMWGKSQ